VHERLDVHAHRQSHSDVCRRGLLRRHELGRRDSVHAAKRLCQWSALRRQHLQVTQTKS
jgi:hypothetical protein